MSIVAQAEVRALWRALVRQFPAWSLPFDVLLNPSTYRFIGADLMQSMWSDGRVRRAADALAAAPPELLAALATVAELNERRANDAFKAVAVAYITVPIALAALVSEAAPDAMRATILANADSITPIVLAFVLTPIVYFCGYWRAKQIAWTIDLYRSGALAQIKDRDG